MCDFEVVFLGKGATSTLYVKARRYYWCEKCSLAFSFANIFREAFVNNKPTSEIMPHSGGVWDGQ